ncbi:uncharacterized protein LOC124302827 [Neodiprion virginianus]|uniref:uncharacterized protein LOC124302827 n=1 Tax=Neodiprion virginianus TaxID=2961670 RepID=UPI001EE70DB7|nr:uncharacterized protein LOC124302827 [Neodiprion virginianus]
MTRREEHWEVERGEMKEMIRDLGKRLEEVEERRGGEMERVKKRLIELEKKSAEGGGERQVQGNAEVAQVTIDRLKEMEWAIERKEREKRRGNIVVRGARLEKGREKEELKKILQLIGVEVEVKDMWEVGAKKGGEKGIWIARLGNREQKRQVMGRKSLLKGREERIGEDLTWAERRMKWKLREIAAIEERRGNRVRIGYAKIWIEGKMWKWDEIGELLRDAHEQLTTIEPEKRAELPYYSDDLYATCEEAFLTNKADMLVIIKSWRGPEPLAHDGAPGNALTSRQLPQFHDLFQVMVGQNQDISNVEKLQYLKMSLTGDASLLLKNISVAGDNFGRAWETLVNRYQNKRVLIDAYLAILFSTRRVNNESAVDLKQLLNDTKDALGALKSLGSPIEYWDHILVYMTARKLDFESLKAWEINIGAQTDPASFDDLEQFLFSRVRALEAVDRVSTSLHGRTLRAKLCLMHKVALYFNVSRVSQQNTGSAARASRTAKSVFQLSRGAPIQKLSDSKAVQVCTGPHHTTIHRSKAVEQRAPGSSATSPSETPEPSKQTNGAAIPGRDDQPSTSVSTNVALTSTIQYKPVLLATALVKVTSRTGEELIIRALLDQASEVSFVTESLAQRLALPRMNTSLPIRGIGGKRTVNARGLVNLNIQSRIRTFSLPVNAYILAKLTSYVPPCRVLKNNWPHLENLELADPDSSSTRAIDLLLGAEAYSVILEEGLRKGDQQSPIAQQTALGWILSGSIPSQDPPQKRGSAYGFQCSADHELLSLLQRFWLQEETTSNSETLLSEEDSQCEQHFVETHSRSPEGRYIVRIPLKQLPDNPGDSRRSALFALSRQEKQFEADPARKTAYSDFLAEYENLGHMTLVPNPYQASGRVFYLPHHAVVRDNSTTTKIRVVFNGSALTTRKISINSLQYAGAKLQNDLADVITRWRRYAYVFTADIEKMYRQIGVHPDDWDLQRILWRKNPQDPVSTYQLCTVTYGLKSAPYLALRVLRQLAADEKSRFSLAVNIIEREIYVDDVLSGADDVEGATEKIRQINECLASGCFNLQKWTSNCEELLEKIPQKRGTYRSSFPLKITIQCERSGSYVAQIFDPLGWIAPVVVRGKIFIQELWSAGLNWDDPLPKILATRWRIYEEELKDIALISVPRYFGSRANLAASQSVELHGFSDASQSALSAVVFLRLLTGSNDIRVSLVAAKTRVAPLKKVTIPRLELSAAVLLVRLVSHLRKVLELENATIHLWTDSTVALAYISGDPSRWTEYVRNRVNEIREIDQSQWHHVSGKENPADCASRGISPRQLQEDSLWWNGPVWLSQHISSWPSLHPPVHPDVALELRKLHAHIVNTDDRTIIWDLVQRYSSLTKLLHVSAWCFRTFRKFLQRQDAPSRENPLTPAELEHARLFWVKATQSAYFNAEIQLLSEEKQLPRSNRLLRLAPFVDSNGLLRVGGRLHNSPCNYDEKHPLILPQEASLTTLVIDQAHRKTLHGGTQVTLVTLRSQYWVVGGRVPVRSFIRRCITCIRNRAMLGYQLMGQLPPSRFSQVRPFINSGVDYAGPIFLRTFRGRGARTYKGYIVVFVCFSTSAIHLEMATDYSSEGFIAAYKRFTSRRGICETLTSDCETNLVGADAELRRLFQATSKEFSTIATSLANDGTLWKFNPPSAPHFGGKWEAAVKSVKFHLKRVIGDSRLSYEEYATLLAQIEGVLNSRPLCALSDDPSDLYALTPGHFLIGSALNAIPEPSLGHLPTSRLSRWQLLRQMLEHFWSRWSSEYLQQMQLRAKWHYRTNALKINSLVLIKDERYPPIKWALGQVVELHPGKDDLVRVVSVRTQHSTYKRPIVKLCLLQSPDTDKPKDTSAD